ncbi:hypothetical protein, partial [Actinoplanes sp. NPDC051494]|uniref:hypothetical protein n=1 Tax=Actinoplanes sp. NPDC051494 TaxID=3363907 RepID=UPI00378F2499
MGYTTIRIPIDPGPVRIGPRAVPITLICDGHILRRLTIRTRQRPMRRPTIRREPVKICTITGGLMRDITTSVAINLGPIRIFPRAGTITAIRNIYLLRRLAIRTRQRPMRRLTIRREPVKRRAIRRRLMGYTTIRIPINPRPIRILPRARTIAAIRNGNLLRRLTIRTRQRAMRRLTIRREPVKSCTITGGLMRYITTSIPINPRPIRILPRARTVTAIRNRHFLR